MSLFNQNQDKKIPLPSSRFLQFFYLFRINLGLLAAVSITSFAFFLPLLFTIMYSYTQFVSAYHNSMDSNSLFSILFITSLIIIPCILISGIGSMGTNHVIKKLIIGDYCKYSDFYIGIKENFKNQFYFYIISALSIFFVIFNFAIYLFIDISPIIKLVTLIASILIFTFTFLTKPYYILISMLFENTKFLTLKNSYIIALSKLFRNIGMSIVSISIYALFFLFTGTSKTIFSLVLIVIGGAFYSLVNLLNSLDVIEKTFDKSQLENLYHKGLIDEKNNNKL